MPQNVDLNWIVTMKMWLWNKNSTWIVRLILHIFYLDVYMRAFQVGESIFGNKDLALATQHFQTLEQGP